MASSPTLHRHLYLCLPPQVSAAGGDPLVLEKLTDAVAVTIRLHSQVG